MSDPITLSPLVLAGVFAGIFALGFVTGIAVDDLADKPFGKEKRTMKDRIHRLTNRARARVRLAWAKGTRYGDRSRFEIVMPWLVIVAVAASGLSSIQLAATKTDTERLTACVAEYNQKFSEAYRARLTSSGEASSALDEIVRAVARRDGPGIQRTVARYVQLRDKVKADQARNPYPPLPVDYCGPVVTR